MRTTLFNLPGWPSTWATFFKIVCDVQGLAQLGLALVRRVHGYTSCKIDNRKTVPSVNAESKEVLSFWKEVLKRERRIHPKWVFSINLASMVYRLMKRSTRWSWWICSLVWKGTVGMQRVEVLKPWETVFAQNFQKTVFPKTAVCKTAFGLLGCLLSTQRSVLTIVTMVPEKQLRKNVHQTTK